MAEQQQSVINLDWIDEEVRQYRNELTTAQQRINTQDEEIRELSRHLEDLEARLASQQTQLNRIAVLERALEQYKEEIRLLVEKQEEADQQDRREAARIRLIEQDNMNRSLNEMRRTMAGIPRLEEELEVRTAEDRRLNEAQQSLRQRTMELEKRIDVAVRPVPFLQEQHSRDAKYIAQLQEQVSALLKNVDGLTNRFLVVEELSHRNRQNVEDLINIRSEIQQSQRRFLEEMQVIDQERQRRVNDWTAAEDVREQRMREFAEQMRLFGEQYQKVKSALANLESLAERLQREQHEAAELQRLSEERQRTHIEEWESQAEKRWQREKLLWEQQWHDHDRRSNEHVERLQVVEGRSKANEEQVGHLWETVLDDLRLRTEAAQNSIIRLSEEIETRRGRKKS